MDITKLSKGTKYIRRLFTDNSLTKKAYLNGLTAALDYGSNLIVGYFTVPWLVTGLGDYFYGVWQILSRLLVYITPAGGKPTMTLRMTLANLQTSTDYEAKRRHVGAAVIVWAVFLPIMSALGAVIAWFCPYWIKVPDQYIWQIRLAAAVLIVDLIATNLSALPQSVMQGENLGYKRMGLSASLIFIGGGFTWLALYFKTGIIGVAAAVVAYDTMCFIFYLSVVRSFVPWAGIARPSMANIKRFMGLSWWFVAWDSLQKLMNSSDVILLGILGSVQSVTFYSLTKYAPEILISVIAIVAFGVMPGVGGVIGAKKLDKAAQLRGEIITITWLLATSLGSTVLLWNRIFLGLWVGQSRYAGTFVNLLVVLVVTQLVLIKNDSNIIDLTLRLKNKVLLGAISVGLALSISGILVYFFKLGIVGMLIGLMLGRLVLSIGYPTINGRFLNLPLSTQLKSLLKPAFITALMFSITASIDAMRIIKPLSGFRGWAVFFFSGGTTFIVLLLIVFYLGLSMQQRQGLLKRVRAVISNTEQ